MREDAWLGERLGCSAWTVEDDDDADALAKGVPGFYQAKVPAADVARVGELEAAGFRVVDVNLTLRREPDGAIPHGSLVARDARHEDRDAVLAIAERDYTVSRFHLDPAIPDEVARRIKRDWAENFFRGQRGDRLFVVELEDRVVGFHLVIDRPEASIIDLIAVSEPARRSGAGRALVTALLESSQARPVLVGTQVSNVGALGFYERLGFTALASQFVLHRHV